MVRAEGCTQGDSGQQDQEHQLLSCMLPLTNEELQTILLEKQAYTSIHGIKERKVECGRIHD